MKSFLLFFVLLATVLFMGGYYSGADAQDKRRHPFDSTRSLNNDSAKLTRQLPGKMTPEQRRKMRRKQHERVSKADTQEESRTVDTARTNRQLRGRKRQAYEARRAGQQNKLNRSPRYMNQSLNNE
ncbi:MAG: hypothetical protein WC989_02120 [Micavibrio sp.]